MRQIAITLILFLLPALGIQAQGTVTVTQSADIDALVNGKKGGNQDKNMSREERREAKKAAKERKRIEKARQKNQQLVVPTQPKGGTQRHEISRAATQPSRPATAKEPKITVKEPSSDNARDYKRTVIVRRPVRRVTSTETHKVLRRKTLNGAKKVKGFRVSVYSGGNTREAREQAEQAGQKVKAALPDQPVYVHFYSPRWMCLVGNFTNYDEAKAAMRKIRKIGYGNANVIRTMITVRNVTYEDIADEIEY